MSAAPRTLFDKIWDEHVIAHLPGGFDLLHVDRHMLFELTGSIAFKDTAAKGRRPRNPELSFATVDHVISTERANREAATSADGRNMIAILRDGLRKYPSRAFFDVGDPGQGIVHVVAPEQGIALPGLTLLCGDSHTCTVGGLGALSWGIGSSEVEHVFTTQTIAPKRPKTLRATFDGRLGAGVLAKDMVLALIGRIGAGGGTGHAIEFAGPAVRALSVEGRLTLCNMAIELGSRMGQVAPDDTTYDYLAGRPFAPKGALWDRALAHWRTLPTDDGATFAHEVSLDAGTLKPQITWGTSPEHVMPVDGLVPDPNGMADPARREAAMKALRYMGVVPGTPIADSTVDVVFIGSCTNSRLSDLEAAAAVTKGRKIAPGVRALVVPGSGLVAAAAEAKGLDKIFVDAGFEWRTPGCSMCAAANGDRVAPGARSVSTSNRNFEGRQGSGARTHLASPATAAASAIAGRIADPRRYLG